MKKYVKQTGVIFELNPKDYRLGASPIIMKELIPSGDWRDYAPIGEIQANMFVFDTLSCATFSALNVIETWITYLISKNKISTNQIKKLTDLGFFIDNKFNASDRFTAIMSGTTKSGNTLQNVWNSIIKHGLLPDKDLPFDPNFKKWEEYHNVNCITQEMKDKALKILDIFDFYYEWNTTEVDKTNTLINTALKCCPLQGAIPNPATHAIEIIAPGYIYNSYDPYLQELKKKVNYSLRTLVSVKSEVQKYKYFNTKSDPKMVGIKDELMKIVDTMRGECGFPFIITSGYRTPEYNATLTDSVSDSAHCTGEAIDLACNDSTKRMKMVQSAIKNGINRIGVSSTFIHLDIAKDKPLNVMWTY